jgi:hypothetical protein
MVIVTVIKSDKWPRNPVMNPNPMSSHKYARILSERWVRVSSIPIMWTEWLLPKQVMKTSYLLPEKTHESAPTGFSGRVLNWATKTQAHCTQHTIRVLNLPSPNTYQLCVHLSFPGFLSTVLHRLISCCMPTIHPALFSASPSCSHVYRWHKPFPVPRAFLILLSLIVSFCFSGRANASRLVCLSVPS